MLLRSVFRFRSPSHPTFPKLLFCTSAAQVAPEPSGAVRMAVQEGITFYKSLAICRLPRARGCERIECRIRTDLDVCQLAFEDRGTFLSFVRDVDEYMVEELRNPSYHLELISAEPSGFRCQIAFGNPHLRPPKPRKACISCDQENAISQVSKIGSSELNNVWLDGKARANTPFIVTPKRHLEALGEMTDEEVLDMFRQAAGTIRILDSEDGKDPFDEVHEKSSAASGIRPKFFRPHTLILNQGNFRNLAHIHLKVRLPIRVFEQVREHWPLEHFQRWSHLEDYREDKRLMDDYVGGGSVTGKRMDIPERIAALMISESSSAVASSVAAAAAAVEEEAVSQAAASQ